MSTNGNILSTTQVAAMHGCTTMTVRNAIERGDLRAQRVGYYYTVRRRDAERWSLRHRGRPRGSRNKVKA